MIARRLAVVIALSCACALAFAIGWKTFSSIAGLADDEPPNRQNRWTTAELAAFDDFPVFWLGDEFEGLPLEAILPEPDNVTLVYGDCEIEPSDSSCPAPFQVSSYAPCAIPFVQPPDIAIEGNPASRYTDGHLQLDVHGTHVILIGSTGSVEEVNQQVGRAALDITRANPTAVIDEGATFGNFTTC